MARRKAIFRARWTGETVNLGDDTLLFLILEEDPERMIMLTITPTLAKKLQRKLGHMIASGGIPTSGAAFYGYED